MRSTHAINPHDLSLSIKDNIFKNCVSGTEKRNNMKESLLYYIRKKQKYSKFPCLVFKKEISYTKKFAKFQECSHKQRRNISFILSSLQNDLKNKERLKLQVVIKKDKSLKRMFSLHKFKKPRRNSFKNFLIKENS